MKNNLIIFSLFLVVGCLANNSTTSVQLINNSPYVLLLSSYFVSPVTFPVAIAPFSGVDFQLQNNDTRLCDYLNALQYDCYLGSIGDLYDINFAGASPLLNEQALAKKIGNINLFYFSDSELGKINIGISSNASDPLLSNQLLLNTELCSQSDTQNSSCIYGDGVVPVRGNMTIQASISINDDNSDLFSTKDLLLQWQKFDPEEKGKFMEDLEQCVFQDETLFNSSLVFDDFDETYNSVGWSIGRTFGDAFIEEPLRSYEDAISYYKAADYVETACDEIVSQPSIALYCQPSNDTEINGGCKEDGPLNYTHVAVRISSSGQKWASKFGGGPLLSHESLSAISRSNCPVSTNFSVGQPVLCFKKPFDITVKIENKSPFSLSIANVTVSEGFWKNSKIPASNLPPFIGNDSYGIQSGQKAQIFIWYRVTLGALSSSKTMGYLSLYSRIRENLNIFSLCPAILSSNVPFELLHMTYFSQVGDSAWQNRSIEIEGGPVSINITGELINDAKTLLARWIEVDPTHRGKTLEDLSRCVFQNQTLFENAKVIDDFDDNYNAFGWTVGNTIQGNFEGPLQDENSAIEFYKSYNFTVVDCSNAEFSVALFCNLDATTGECKPLYDAISGNYTFTHAALKLSNNEWSSKFWSGPLLTHPDLDSISGNCSDTSSLPVSTLGSKALCFDKLSPVEDLDPSKEYPIFSDNLPQKASSIGTDLSGNIQVQNKMQYDLMRPYNPYQFRSGHTLDTSPVLEADSYQGLEVNHGYWLTIPPPYLPSGQETAFALKDYSLVPSGTEGAVSFHVKLGDVQNYLMLRSKLPTDVEKNRYSLKSMEKDPNALLDNNPIRLSFSCPLFGSNYASISSSTILNPCPMCEKLGYKSRAPVKKLVFAKMDFWGVHKPPSFLETFLFWAPPTDHPMEVTYNFQQNPVSLKELLNNWIQTGWNYRGEVYVANIIVLPVIHIFEAVWQLGSLPNSSFINCSLSLENQKLCDAMVLDDVDEVYNSVSWSLGVSGNAPETKPLIDKNSAKIWYGYIGYEETPCYVDFSMPSEVAIALYCMPSPSPDGCGRYRSADDIIYTYTHAARKKNNVWTSKLITGPLITHNSPEDIIYGFGFVNLCFKKSAKAIEAQPFGMPVGNEKLDFTSQEFALIRSVTNKISQSKVDEFTALLAKWHFVYSQIYLPNLVHFNYDPLYELENSLKESLLFFVRKNPEALYLIVQRMMSQEKSGYHYVIFKFITGITQCGEGFTGPTACYYCAKKWLQQSQNQEKISN